MAVNPFLRVDGVTHRFGERTALDDLSFGVPRGEIFGLLGPNGSGKTTLFRLLSTLLPLRQGTIQIGDCQIPGDLHGVRQQLGVVFQYPSLDKKLKVRENLMCQGNLYGLSGTGLRNRTTELLRRFRLAERANEPVENLSGGLARRVEIAKALLHRPSVLILDEPTTGLDPGARLDMWHELQALNQADGVTILVTTHLMEDAERCDRLMILDEGRRIALDSPGALRDSLGGNVISIRATDAKSIAGSVRLRLKLDSQIIDDVVRIETGNSVEAHKTLTRVVEAVGSEADAITLAQPTLEDVFIHHTGHQFIVE